MSQTSSRLIQLSFPAELLLEVLQQVPFDHTTVRTLALVHPRIRALLRQHQRSITTNSARKHLPHALTDFPCDEQQICYAWLSKCIRQYDVVDDIMAVLVSDLNCYAVEKHNMALANTGLLLLYRLATIQSYAAKLAFIKTLPCDPLTAIFLAIHYSTFTARYHSQGIINQWKYGRFLDANQLELRNEIEFCFAEGAMNLGPDFISDVLLDTERADTTMMCLYHEYAVHDWDLDTVEGDFMPPITQGPEQDPLMRPRTLYTTMLERMAYLMESPLSEVTGRIKDDVETPDHSLAWLSLAGKARLIKGLDLEYAEDA